MYHPYPYISTLPLGSSGLYAARQPNMHDSCITCVRPRDAPKSLFSSLHKALLLPQGYVAALLWILTPYRIFRMCFSPLMPASTIFSSTDSGGLCAPAGIVMHCHSLNVEEQPTHGSSSGHAICTPDTAPIKACTEVTRCPGTNHITNSNRVL